MSAKRDIQVFISGPLGNAGEQIRNVSRALSAASLLANSHPRIRPFIPHLFVFWDFLDRHSRDFYMEIDLATVCASQAVFRLRGESPGADEETALAARLEIPVYHCGHDGEGLFELVSDIRTGVFGRGDG